MNVIIEYTILADATNFITSAKAVLPLIRAFMDDLNLMAQNTTGAQNLLSRCAKAFKWARMNFRLNKSRSIIIVKGRTINSAPFTVNHATENILSLSVIGKLDVADNARTGTTYIPSIQNNPVKFLGRIIDGALDDSKRTDELQSKLLDGLNLIDQSNHSSAEKLWILHYLLMPRIRWPLLIYEIPMYRVFKLEQKISTFIRKWIGLHRTTTNLSFYSTTSPCPLPLTSLTSILKAQKVSGHLQLRDSCDPLISSSVPVLKAGTFVVEDAVKDAESALKFEMIRGNTQSNKAGLGINKAIKSPSRGTKDHGDLVFDTVKQLQENNNYPKEVTLEVQGSGLSG